MRRLPTECHFSKWELHWACYGLGPPERDARSPRVDLEGRCFWTWCAYDILASFGALGASGGAQSPSRAVLFRPDEALLKWCENVYAKRCRNSNLFAGADPAARWAAEHAIAGKVMGLEEAADCRHAGLVGRGPDAGRCICPQR
jgi:hypothetical protein